MYDILLNWTPYVPKRFPYFLDARACFFVSRLTVDTHVSDNRRSKSFLIVGLWRSLGARFHGMEEVVGSIPTRSTIHFTRFDIFISSA